MDVAFDGVNRVHASRLRLLKEMQERSALRELSKKEGQRRMATLAVQNAFQGLAIARQQRARAEAQLYQELMSLDTLAIAALDHHHLHIERLAAEVTFKSQMLDDARIAQEKAETSASETRALWVRRSAARRKWQQIEDDVRRAVDMHSEAAGEIEADDEISLRYGRLSLAQMSRNQIR
ncbi:hypothetical protein JQK88_30040 [Mesorhizobium caraganae]|uniref:hypothetical protein n=1 Tax=Mesorhizobium caraganae TaxID=483206 RepID=UPI0019392A0B|nr:hypothetical protein [Mesorhizobium caraganae]MBM2715371.1 hypothetical protein [Mesorhizobium caraganae]